MAKDWLEEMAELSVSTGVWCDLHERTLIHMIENNYKREHIRKFYVADLLRNGDKYLIKWQRRIILLTDEELDKRFG